MPRGGKRPGSGRKTLTADGPAETISIKAPVGLHDRLRAAADELDITHAAVLGMGVDAAEAKVAARGAAQKRAAARKSK
jgi:hypothetical protein